MNKYINFVSWTKIKHITLILTAELKLYIYIYLKTTENNVNKDNGKKNK